MSLTSGVLGDLSSGKSLPPTFDVQVLAAKPVGSNLERYRLLLSDGVYQHSFSMLNTNLNHLVLNNKLEKLTIIRIKQHQTQLNQKGTGKNVLIITDLDIVAPGAQVGQQIGNPVIYGQEPKSNNAQSNQNRDPNIGAQKRSADSMLGGPVNKVPARSVLTAKPSLDSSSHGHVVSPIQSITPYQNKWTIKARVTSKSDIRTWNKASGSGKLFSMDLMDESGEIRATAFKEQVDQYYDMIQVGKVYYISRCSVKSANKQYSKLNNDYEITFKDNVLVEPVLDNEASDVPTMSYQFAAISDLSQANKDSIVDIIGICKDSMEPVTITTRAGKELVKREVTVCDESNAEVTLTLWGATAESFSAEGNPVIAVKGARVSDYNGVTLSGGDLLCNPEIEQTSTLKGWWNTKGRSTEFNSMTVAGQRSGGMGSNDAFKSLGEVKAEQLGTQGERGDYYNTMATITYFQKDKALYKACPNQVDGRECNKKVTEGGDGSYRCEKCSVNLDSFKWRLILSLNMGDYSDSIWASCFQETGERLLGMSSEEVGQLSEQDEDRYNAVFNEACFKMYNLRMRAKSDNYNDETRVKHVILSVEPVDYATANKKLIKEIEAMGGSVPDDINRDRYI